MNILVVGSYGQLGNELRRLLESGEAEIGPIPEDYAGAQATYVDYDKLDIRDAQAVQDFCQQGNYDLIINCAAITNVDGCETDEEGAYAVNAYGAKNLAAAANQLGAKFVHVSTDYVFPGTDETPRTEDDPTGPLSAYGRTKLAGEELVAQECPQHFIMRTAWLYGYVGRNFVKTMIALGKERESVTVVDDQVGNPTSANDLAYEILKVATTNNYGVYHCTNEGICSWADFAQAIMEGTGLPCTVQRCTSEEYAQMNPASASRPVYSALQNKHLETTIGNDMRPWQEALATYLEKLPELGD